jgi:aryl-alcohol dehydrogenase-like predicted oxidoreductase
MGAAGKAREARIRPYSTAEQRRWQCPAAAESGELFRGRSLGLAHVDTAQMYRSGAVERLVGRAIKGRRDDIFLVSKVLPLQRVFQKHGGGV